MITRGRLRWFAMIAAGFVAVASCSAAGSAQPRTSPVRPTAISPTAISPTADPSTAGSATASASGSSTSGDAWAQVPRAARAHTYQGAQAFAEYYLNETNDAWSRPDWRLLVPLATSNCKSCSNYVETARSLEAERQHYDGDSVMVRASAWLPESTRAKAYVSVVAVQLAARIVDAGGRTVERVPKENGISEFELVWRGDRWLVNAIRLVQNP